MTGQFFKFAVKGLRPRPFGLSDWCCAIFWPTFALVAWAWNWLHIEVRAIIPFLAGLIVFVVTSILVLLLLGGAQASENAACECLKIFSHERLRWLTSDKIHLIAPALCGNVVFQKFLSGVMQVGSEIPWLAVVAAYFFARFGQHILDWRDWQTPWAHAHMDRVRAKFGHAGAQDFPILILGRGGSGKSTLAQILEHDFLRRQIFKPSGFQDQGGDERLVVRSTAGAVGGSVRKYDITWRPDLYKVGRLAEAYDMPGQILDDWERAIKEMKNCRRVAIINVVTCGYNATIRKFKLCPREESDNRGPELDLNNGKIYYSLQKENPNDKSPNFLPTKNSDVKKQDWESYCLHHPDNAEQLTKYREHIMADERKVFSEVVGFVKDFWKKGDLYPKLLVIHVVEMADLWTKHSEKDDWRTKSLSVLAHYDIESVHNEYNNFEHLGVSEGKAEPFFALNKELIEHLGEKNVTIKVLPASLLSGKRTHSEEDDFIIFDSEYEFDANHCQKQGSNFEDTMIEKVKKNAILGRSTVKTIRAIRLALYRAYSDKWRDRSTIGVAYPREDQNNELDLYDVWREAEEKVAKAKEEQDKKAKDNHVCSL